MRLRVVFSKDGAARYISHLDLCRTLERAFRRASIPVSYSQGFNPKPRFSVASALMLGARASAEIMDVRLDEDMRPEDFVSKLRSALAPGIQVEKARVLEAAAHDCAAMVAAAYYVIEFSGLIRDACAMVQAFLEIPSVMVQKQSKGKTRAVDARSVVLRIEALSQDQVGVLLDLSGPSLRPSEVAAALIRLSQGTGDDAIAASQVDSAICRQELFARRNGDLVPLFLASI
ncbi:MAG: TIGR03936 family radical SAM-associated protein [Bacillota bacterium]|nr:TIGR03936 family radical SAM-associated protein [Bacillota bacterium]